MNPKVSYSDIETAFEYVSSQPPLTNHAVLCRDSGRIHFASDLGDRDEDFPDCDFLEGNYVAIPHKHDLDLGTRLVWRFVRECAPELIEAVSEIFSRKGAYSRFKGLLRRAGKLDAWHNYENAASRRAIMEWCKDNDIELDEISA